MVVGSKQPSEAERQFMVARVPCPVKRYRGCLRTGSGVVLSDWEVAER